MYSIKRTLRSFIKNLMGLGKTTLMAISNPIAQVSIKCSICQGDALFPLLFYIGLNPFNQVTSKSSNNYLFQSEATISRHVYIKPGTAAGINTL